MGQFPCCGTESHRVTLAFCLLLLVVLTEFRIEPPRNIRAAAEHPPQVRGATFRETTCGMQCRSALPDTGIEAGGGDERIP